MCQCAQVIKLTRTDASIRLPTDIPSSFTRSDGIVMTIRTVRAVFFVCSTLRA